MARGIEGNETSSRPKTASQKPTPSAQSSQKNQKTLFGFFQKQASAEKTSSPTPHASSPAPVLPKAKDAPKQTLTPVVSSDPITSPSPERTVNPPATSKTPQHNGLPSPISSDAGVSADAAGKGEANGFSSPPRRVSY